jgi:hypothetical protein
MTGVVGSGFNMTTMFDGHLNDSVGLHWLHMLDAHSAMQGNNGVTSLILTVLYIPTFLLAVTGNVLAIIVLSGTAKNSHITKNSFLINLVITDLSGKSLI